ncbi:hypothetical protein ABE10_02745, partial [Bacillus toyonensis]|nr:hypothetical protein [Bacillus toyonensis]
ARIHHDDPMQRRDRGEDASVLDQRSHVSEEQGQQERPDVGAVDVRIAHEDDLPVPRRGQVEGTTGPRPDDLDDRRAFGVRKHVADRGLLHVEDLAPDRQQRLILAVSRVLGRAERRITLDDEELGL